LFLVIVVSSDAPSTLETTCGLASAAACRGHGVTIFFYMEGVRLLEASRVGDLLVSLVSAGVRLLACRTSVHEWGIGSGDGLVEGVEMSSLGELVDLLDGFDRAVFLG